MLQQEEAEEEIEEEDEEATAEINQVFEMFSFPPQRLKALKMNEWLRICEKFFARSFQIVSDRAEC